MADAFLVKIDLERLRANVSATVGRAMNDEEIRQLLMDHGFEPHPDGWVCEEVSLGFLVKEEILSATPL